MKTQHTPGPWRFDSRAMVIWGKSVGGCLMEDSEHKIADVRGWGHLGYRPDGIEVFEANGRIIAAAPDLLEALQQIAEIDRYDVRTLSDQGPVYIYGQCGTIAIEAIAKATGCLEA